MTGATMQDKLSSPPDDLPSLVGERSAAARFEQLKTLPEGLSFYQSWQSRSGRRAASLS
jgi:hypothetical protein